MADTRRDLLTVTEVHRLTGYSRDVIYSLISTGALRAIQVHGMRGMYRITRMSYEDFLNGRRGRRGLSR